MAFRDTITGYHLLNGDIIRHAVWEGINKQVYTSLLVVGKKVTTDISSYRLSKEINDKDES